MEKDETQKKECCSPKGNCGSESDCKTEKKSCCSPKGDCKTDAACQSGKGKSCPISKCCKMFKLPCILKLAALITIIYNAYTSYFTLVGMHGGNTDFELEAIANAYASVLIRAIYEPLVLLALSCILKYKSNCCSKKECK